MAINPIQRSLILENIASVIDNDAYVPNGQTSNGEAKDVEDEGKITMMKARSNKRAANRGNRFQVANSNYPRSQLQPYAKENFHE
jgi:hypothetical protein